MASAASPTTTGPTTTFVFPVLKDEDDLIITNYVDDASSGLAAVPTPAEDDRYYERIGRIADWTGLSADGPGGPQRRGGHHHHQRGSALINTAGKQAEEEDEGWNLSQAAPSAPATGRRPMMTAAGAGGGRPGSLAMAAAVSMGASTGPSSSWASRGNAGQARSGAQGGRRPYRPEVRIREPSIRTGPEWRILEEIEFGRLAKVQINAGEPEVLKAVGSVPVYDWAFDKVKVRAERAMPPTADLALPCGSAAASEDPVMQKMAAEGAGQIFTTDTVASLLMACSRTVQPWDVVVRRRGSAVFLDSRKDAKNDMVFVNETANEAPYDEAEGPNSVGALAAEATRINLALPALMAKAGERCSLGEAAPTAFRYVRVDLGEALSMVVRCSVSTALGGDSFGQLRAFLEFQETRLMGWRQKLEAQRGAVLAHEIKNNGAQLARWLYQTILADCGALRLAYVSRINSKPPGRHALLAVQEYEPYELASQMGLNVANGFGIIRALAEICLDLPEGGQEYALLRDANKPMLRLYATQ